MKAIKRKLETTKDRGFAFGKTDLEHEASKSKGLSDPNCPKYGG